ncbi:spore germination lipoprotein GerD [Paenibacillus koleovorans]|uniref:spore germination lipoprotein GerD n=1 Tax=Paenibacillus koleovorans TaxID=121608 RepID=UPI000FDB9FCB|nr:spore germination lipoprotein GerD [Paenibacillus koleovorans]
MNAKSMRWIAVLLLPILASCGGGSSQGGSQSGGGSYKETKSMVLDILKTEEGKKAIAEANLSEQNSSMKLLSTDTGQQVQLAVKEILTAEDTDKIVRQLMVEPKFAGDFAKAIQKQNKQLQKDLMKDPEYQKQMVQIMNNPEYEKIVLDVLKTTPYRQQTAAIMQETMQSPLFKAQIMEMLQKVVKEQTNPPEQKNAKGGGGSGGSGEQGGKEDQGKEQDKGSNK